MVSNLRDCVMGSHIIMITQRDDTLTAYVAARDKE